MSAPVQDAGLPSAPRRVLMSADTVGGVLTYATELARALAARGVEVTLGTMGGPIAGDARRRLEAIDGVRVEESDFRLEWMPEPWDDVRRAGEWLLELAARDAADVIHLNGYAHGALPWPAPVLVVAHSCVLSWWRAVRRTPLPASWTAYREAVTRGLAAAHVIAAPSRAMLRALHAEYGPIRTPSVVIPNGRDAAEFRPLPPSAKLPVVFTAGRLWDEAKNAVALARVAPRLPWPVHVAGPIAAPDGAPVALDHVRALGTLPARQLAARMSAAAIYALPARYEPFGLTVLEAALSGCALVLGRIASLEENWDGAAVFVDPDDDAALERAIRELIADAPRRHELARRARARAVPLSTSRMVESYLAVYRRLPGARLASAVPEERPCTS